MNQITENMTFPQAVAHAFGRGVKSGTSSFFTPTIFVGKLIRQVGRKLVGR